MSEEGVDEGGDGRNAYDDCRDKRSRSAIGTIHHALFVRAKAKMSRIRWARCLRRREGFMKKRWGKGFHHPA
jgi:predicted NAD/FAD-binding protein